jgi:hypothetical protein
MNFTDQAIILTCFEFNSWSEVNDELKSQKCDHPPDRIFLHPSNSIPLTNELNITLLPSSQRFNLFGVNGVNLYPWPASPGFDKKLLWLYFSKIEFFVNNTPPSEYTCSPGLIPDDSATQFSLFSTHLLQLFVYYGNTYETGSGSVCPYLFRNAQLYGGVNLFYQVESFLFVSLFRFQEVNETKILSINSSIYTLEVDKSYNYKLDTSLLHALVFEKIATLICSGTIKSIQSGLFKNFQGLTEIQLTLVSPGNFNHSIGLKWTEDVNMSLNRLLFKWYIFSAEAI